MANEIKLKEVEKQIIEIRGQNVILDTDVAKLYKVETKRVNEAVKNNPQKFPKGYIIRLTKEEWSLVKSNFSTSPSSTGGGKVKLPRAFTEKGLYMLATILKSKRATETTLSIIEAFTKVRKTTRLFKQISKEQEGSPEQRALVKKTEGLISDLIIPKEAKTSESEASLELNFALVKLKYSVKKKK